jgi:molybdopterin-guanine dinucleotide biosynthesis protein A
MNKVVKGLVLAGGFSRRMGRDKALLSYHNLPQARWTAQLLSSVCSEVYYSCRADQDLGPGTDLSAVRIHDTEEGQGPIGGMLEAHRKSPESAWLIVACDLPKLDQATLKTLIRKRNAAHIVTAYRSIHDGLPEPLCAIYEPKSFSVLAERFADGCRCPRRVLIDLDRQVQLLNLEDGYALDNANTPDEASALDVLPKINPD